MNAFNQRPTRAARTEATARAVLAAAREEFQRVGFEAASLRGIAARAGVSAGTVLHHFGDKRDLLHAALFEDLEATLARALGRAARGPLAARLRLLGRSVFRAYRRRPALSRTLLKESLFATGDWGARFAAQTGRVHAAVTGWARVAAARGELPAHVDAELLAAAWLAFFYFGLLAWAQGSHPAPERLVERLTAQHLGDPAPAPRRPRRPRP